MKPHLLLSIAATAAIALSGCSMMGHSDTDQASSSSSGTMRRAESGSNTTPNSTTRDSDCVPADTRENCPPNSTGSQSGSLDRSSESSTDVDTSQSGGAPVPR